MILESTDTDWNFDKLLRYTVKNEAIHSLYLSHLEKDIKNKTRKRKRTSEKKKIESLLWLTLPKAGEQLSHNFEKFEDLVEKGKLTKELMSELLNNLNNPHLSFYAYNSPFEKVNSILSEQEFLELQESYAQSYYSHFWEEQNYENKEAPVLPVYHCNQRELNYLLFAFKSIENKLKLANSPAPRVISLFYFLKIFFFSNPHKVKKEISLIRICQHF